MPLDTILLQTKGCTDIAINESTNTIYALYRDHILVINGRTRETTDKIEVKNFRKMTINPMTNRMYGFMKPYDKKTHAICIIDLNSNKLTGTILCDLKSPDGIAINPKTNKLYVTDWHKSDTLSIIDGDTNLVMARTKLGKGKHDLAVNESSNLVYVANADNKSIFVVDGTSGALVHVIKKIQAPYRLMINSSVNALYVATETGFGGEGYSSIYYTLYIVDTNSHNIVMERKMGFELGLIAINVSNDRVYLIDNKKKISILILDWKANDLLESVELKHGIPDKILVNQKTNKLYLAYDKSNAIDVVEG